MTSESSPERAGLSRVDASGLCTYADLSRYIINEWPFRYATFDGCFPARPSEEILKWLESDAPWRLKRTEFYEQYEFSCWDCTSLVASYLTSSTTLDAVRKTMTEIFGRTFDQSVSVVAHKLLIGQRIGIHNDYLNGQESHRLVIQINHGLSDNAGGYLMIFNSEKSADINRIMRPIHLSGFAFEISPASFHAVSQIHKGIRYSLIYSLRALSD